MMERARHDARTQRQQTVTDQFGSALAIPLNTIVGRPATPVDGWDGQPVDMWRISTWGFITQALTDASSAHCDWSAGEIDIQLALFQRADWTRFWLYEVEASRMPHFWLRAAFEYLQSFHKVTDGTPADSQIGSYAADTDLIVSADRRFIDMCLRCKREAPFDVADATVVGGGSTGVEELFQILEGM